MELEAARDTKLIEIEVVAFATARRTHGSRREARRQIGLSAIGDRVAGVRAP